MGALRDPVQYALKVPTAGRCRAVEITVAALYQPGNRNRAFAKKGVERVQHRCGTGRIHSKYRPLEERAAGRGCAIKITVTALHQPADRRGAVCGQTAERMKGCQVSTRIDLEYSSLCMCAAEWCCAIKIPIAALHQRPFRRVPIGSVERVQSCQALRADSDAAGRDHGCRDC